MLSPLSPALSLALPPAVPTAPTLVSLSTPVTETGMATASSPIMPDEVRRLGFYLQVQWPSVPPGEPVDVAIWLLEHLRRIDESGILPAYDHEGQLVETVAWLVRKVQDTGSRTRET